MEKEIRLPKIVSFEWDKYNKDNNKLKHNVTPIECEEIFLNEPIYFPDKKHSIKEQRYLVYGETINGRFLTIIFTIREDKIRVISARDQSKKEREVYKKYKNE